LTFSNELDHYPLPNHRRLASRSPWRVVEIAMKSLRAVPAVSNILGRSHSRNNGENHVQEARR
jgi:hypothetical protein